MSIKEVVMSSTMKAGLLNCLEESLTYYFSGSNYDTEAIYDVVLHFGSQCRKQGTFVFITFGLLDSMILIIHLSALILFFTWFNIIFASNYKLISKIQNYPNQSSTPASLIIPIIPQFLFSFLSYHPCFFNLTFSYVLPFLIFYFSLHEKWCFAWLNQRILGVLVRVIA